jgi:hypothetical protein
VKGIGWHKKRQKTEKDFFLLLPRYRSKIGATEAAEQGDQIVRTFTYIFGYYVFWAVGVFYFKLLATFSAIFLILTKNGLGYILGDFFTNSSGHTARRESRGGSERRRF